MIRVAIRSLPLLIVAGCLAAIATAATASSPAAPARLAAFPAVPAASSDNPSTPERVALGRLFFWDPIPPSR